ncbi:MAG: hypothetical protein IPL73_16035 [Candidatus Obscuribacter sp.]|nr:hypothetical protein [Candidatus Obscuribacter sp.]
MTCSSYQRLSYWGGGIERRRKKQMLDMLRLKGAEELEYGEEVEHEKVKLVRRVTGAVSIFFEKDAEPAKKKSKE